MSSGPPDPLRGNEEGARSKGEAREIANLAAGSAQPADRVPPHTAAKPPNIDERSVAGTKFLPHLATRSPSRAYFVRLSQAH